MNNQILNPSLHGYEIHHDTCFGCGKENPIGLGADFTFDDQSGEVKFTYNFKKLFNGAPNFVHGGILSTVLDEAMGALCFHLGYIVMTDTMSFKFHKATPVQQEHLIRAWPVKKAKRKVILECELTSTDGQVLYVKGEGAFHILPPRFFSDKLTGGKIAVASELLAVNKLKRAHLFDRISNT
ncbi:PaaI family thioesterase [Leptospira idonii]|uniref:Acyl-coenzyme A thioesterase THEM4 n=1 Tax=Leptospira idonii TaxID=1193500 RepID=A0A4R9LZC6_9LEPT|nr:PaaI family thioesterase [Leptospira idonii]TGN19713.1 PaaI family thioesterase [Leptospira idonii]